MNERSCACPYCGERLDRWEPASESGWGNGLYLCNNNECAYFMQGRKKIGRECEVNFGYRCGYDPEKDRGICMAAWCGGSLSWMKGRCPAG